MAAGNSILIDLEPNIDGFVNSIGAKLGAIGAAVGAAFAFDKILSEAMQADEALNSFSTAARNAGQDAAKASAHMEDLANSIQRTTTVSGDAVTKNAAILVSVGRLSGEALDRATKAAVDLSAGLGKDLNASFDIVAKAAEGNVSALKKYGLEVSNSASDSQKLNAALTFIEQRFGGSAADKVNTFAGALGQLKNNFSDVLENIGKLVTRSPVVIEIFKFISAQVASFAERIGAIGKTGDVFGDLVKDALNFGQTIITWVVAPLELAYNVAKILFFAAEAGISGLIAGLLKVQSAIFNYLSKPIVDFIAGPLGKLVSFFDKEVGQQLTQSVLASTTAIAEASKVASDAATATFVDFSDKTNEAIDNVFNFDVSSKASNFVTQLTAVAEAAKPAAIEAGKTVAKSVEEGFAAITFTDILNATKNTANQIKFTADELAKNLIVTFQNGAQQAFAAFGAGLVTGKNAFAEFGKSILKSLGQLLIQFGGMLILVGLGLSTVPFLFGLSGPAAVAAGIAATVAGGALTALGGGGGGASPAGSAASPGTADAGAAPTLNTASIADTGATQLASVEKKSGPEIHVNIQGNVLDRRSTGLEIAEVIQETFGSNALVFNT